MVYGDLGSAGCAVAALFNMNRQATAASIRSMRQCVGSLDVPGRI